MSRRQVRNSVFFTVLTGSVIGILAFLFAYFGPQNATQLQATAQEPATEPTTEEPPAPATMPEGWQQMSATDFKTAFQAFKAQGKNSTQEHGLEILSHAWSHFLEDPTFMASGNIAEVEWMVNFVINARLNRMVIGETKEERITSKAALIARRNAILASFQARLDNDSGATADYVQLKAANSALYILKAPLEERQDLFADWMQDHDWKSLPMNDIGDLMKRIESEEVDRQEFSVRWTGTITAPTSGAYKFEQVHTEGSEDPLKVKINNRVVLDSSGSTEESRFTSEPVQLTEGQAVSFEAEYTFAPEKKTEEGRVRFPMALLSWESDNLAQEIVPTNAFTPPTGFGPENAKGLKGEYYAWSNPVEDDPTTAEDESANAPPVNPWETVKGTRLDPGLQMIWRATFVFSKYQEEQTAILNEMAPRLLSPEYLNTLETKELAEFDPLFRYGAVPIFAQMKPSERIAFIEAITDRPEILNKISIHSVASIAIMSFMLPSKPHFDFIGEWCDAHADFQTQTGEYPGYARGSYYGRNMMNATTQKLGFTLSREYWDGTTALWDEHLVRENGDCNLNVVFITAFSAKYEEKGDLLKQRLDQKLSEENLSADQRSTWLIGKGLTEEITGGPGIRPIRANRILKKALETAQSEAYRYRAYSEIVSRLIALNKGELAQKFMTEEGSQFSSDGQQAQETAWNKAITDVEAVYAKRRIDVRNRHLKLIRGEIQKRLNHAQSDGNTQGAEQLQSVLQKVNASEVP